MGLRGLFENEFYLHTHTHTHTHTYICIYMKIIDDGSGTVDQAP
jgi:hypothetical protein